jgi:hypothetical protein
MVIAGLQLHPWQLTGPPDTSPACDDCENNDSPPSQHCLCQHPDAGISCAGAIS